MHSIVDRGYNSCVVRRTDSPAANPLRGNDMKMISQEMADEMLSRAETPEAREALKDIDIALLIVATDCPGAEDRQIGIVIREGKLARPEVKIESAPSDLRTASLDSAWFDARVVCRFEKLIDIIQDKISLVGALAYVKIDGDMSKLMKQVNGFAALLKFIGSLPVEWES